MMCTTCDGGEMPHRYSMIYVPMRFMLEINYVSCRSWKGVTTEHIGQNMLTNRTTASKYACFCCCYIVVSVIRSTKSTLTTDSHKHDIDGADKKIGAYIYVYVAETVHTTRARTWFILAGCIHFELKPQNRMR